VSRIAIIGGGFAGVAAACRLSAEGHRPILLERAPRLGGRAASFPFRATGEVLDYGHHVLMRCCTASTGFLSRIGASDAVRFQPTLNVPIAAPNATTILHSSFLPGILHLAPALLRYRVLPPSDRLHALQAGLALLGRQTREDMLFSEWLAAHGQSHPIVRRLWDPICIATLNAPATAVGVHAARKVFRDAFFQPDGANLGLFKVPLAVVFDAARRYIEQRGGTIRTSSQVKRLRIQDERVRGIELDIGETLDCSAAICAVPPPQLAQLTEAAHLASLAQRLADADRLLWAPIINLHIWLDRPVLPHPFVIAVDSPVQAVFDLTQLQGCSSTGRPTHLVLSQSAADAWIGRSVPEIEHALLDALHELFPAIKKASVERTLLIRQPYATFVPQPGTDRLRPRTSTPIHGLYLAGDWTATGWPSTIEGAIRSGIAASARAEQQFSEPS